MGPPARRWSVTAIVERLLPLPYFAMAGSFGGALGDEPVRVAGADALRCLIVVAHNAPGWIADFDAKSEREHNVFEWASRALAMDGLCGARRLAAIFPLLAVMMRSSIERRRGAELDRSRNTCGFELLLPYGDAVMLDATGGATGGAAGWCVRANLVAPGRLFGMDEPPAHIAGSLPEAALFRKMRAHARASGQPFAVTVCSYTIPEPAPPAKRARARAPRMKAIEEAEVAARATDTPIPRPVSVETQ
jgi:hypothetical protein